MTVKDSNSSSSNAEPSAQDVGAGVGRNWAKKEPDDMGLKPVHANWLSAASSILTSFFYSPPSGTLVNNCALACAGL